MKKPVIIAYLYDGPHFSTINPEILKKLDYLNYSFGLIKDGCVTINNDNHLSEILDYKQYQLKINLSIGGWGAGGFSEACQNSTTRGILIDSILKILQQYPFDGIDLDWEYPTVAAAGIGSSPSDKQNFTFLCQELKQALSKINNQYILTMAIPGNDRYYEFEQLNKVVDYFNLMSYDLAITCKKAFHDANLYSTNFDDHDASADKGVSILLKHLDPEKIIIGSAFYGRFGEFADDVTPALGNSLKDPLYKGYRYAKIKELLKSGEKEFWDDTAKASYFIIDNKFITYDSVRSIKEKVLYVKNHHLGGIMFWELGQADTEDLINSMFENIK